MGSTLLQKMLKTKDFSLIISLAANDLSLAQAAIEEGIDGVKVHINVDHRASGNRFGTLAENLEMFKELRAMFDGPLGIVPGGSHAEVRKEELEELAALGFNYYSIYGHHMAPWMLELEGYEKTFAINESYPIDLVKQIHKFPIDGLETSIIPGAEYGTPLSFKDLLMYADLVEKAQVPVIVPSQRKVVPSDIPALKQAGVKALMIGAIVTGHSVEEVKRAVHDFRNAVDK